MHMNFFSHLSMLGLTMFALCVEMSFGFVVKTNPLSKSARPPRFHTAMDQDEGAPKMIPDPDFGIALEEDETTAVKEEKNLLEAEYANMLKQMLQEHEEGTAALLEQVQDDAGQESVTTDDIPIVDPMFGIAPDDTELDDEYAAALQQQMHVEFPQEFLDADDDDAY